jgi:hypothetical protein
VVSDACLRLVEMTGHTRWLIEFQDPIEIAGICDDTIVCRSLIADGNRNFWSAGVHIKDGALMRSGDMSSGPGCPGGSLPQGSH